MKTVGEILKQERIKQKKTIAQLHRQTKIPEKTLVVLEKDDYSQLPSATFIKGFIKIYAQNLGLDEKKLLAVFRRDWEKQEEKKILPKGLAKPLNRQSFWTPSTGLILILSFIAAIILFYFGFQLKNFLLPPSLVLTAPTEDQKIDKREFTVIGKTNKDVNLTINGQTVSLENDGSFSYKLKALPGEKTIVVIATDRHGKKTTIQRTVEVIDKEP